MRTFKYYMTILVLAGVLLSGFAFGLDREGLVEPERTLQKPLVLSALNFDGNRIDNDLMNNGMIVSHLVSGRSGLSWPKGNNTQTIYASGVWLGAKVNNQVRVVAGEFAGELAGGPWGSDPSNPAHKLYKVSKSDLADPLASDDFQNWPASLGAPFIDNNGNGTYEPMPSGPDHPDFIGDQVIWAVMNDGDPTSHSVFNSPPMGLEVQMTVFGFDRPDAFGDMMFVKELIINRGNETLNEMIIGLWSDPDLGDAADDLVGCDTTLGLGIVYNAGADVNFAGYSGGTPAAGYDFFQGPMVPAPGETAYMFNREIPDMRNLKMTSFTKYINADPVYYDPNNAEEAYYYMSGFLPDGSEFPFAASGGTKFVHPGDPTKDTGPTDTEYVDSDLHPPDDRRFLMNAGPFTMVPGDSQEVVFGILHAAAGGPLDSYLYLKNVDALAQLAYDIHFALPPSPPNPIVEVTTFEDEIILTWDTAAELYKAEDLVDLDPDGNSTEFVFEGYNVYQIETASGSGAVKRLATFDLANGLTEIYDDVFDANFGESINRRVQFGSDSGMKRSLNITADAINNGAALLTNRMYYFAVTAYGYNPYGIPKTLESPFKIMAIRPQVNTTWMSEEETAVYGTAIAAEHTAGPSDGVAQAVVVNPKALTGDDYELSFATENYYLDFDGFWKNTSGSSKAKPLDVSPSMVTGVAVTGPGGTLDLNFEIDVQSPDYDYASGVLITVPGAVINNATGPGGIAVAIQADGQSVLFGDLDLDGLGDFAGGEHVTINVRTSSVNQESIGFDFVIYDDGWADLLCDTDRDGVIDPDMLDYCNAYGLGPGNAVIANAEGSGTITEFGYAYKAIEGWYATNLTTGEIVTPHTTIQSGVATDNIVAGVFIPGGPAGTDAGPIAEGLQFAVDGPELGINRVSETDQADVVLDANVGVYPPSLGTTGYILSHRDHAGLGAGRTHDRFDYWGMDDVFIDFSETSLNFSYSGATPVIETATGLPGTLPFSIYRVKFPSGDRVRLFAGIWDTDGDGAWGATDPYWTDYGKPSYEGIYAWQGYGPNEEEIAYDPANDATYIADGGLPNDTGHAFGSNPGFFHYPFMTATMVVMYTATATPPWGNRIWMITNKANTNADKFLVSTAGLLGSAKAYDTDGIKAWPNPYFGFNPEERDPIDQQIHFTNLPVEGKCTIRIFDLAGVPVKTLEHTNGTTLEIWNIKNNSNIPVASGMYIVIVETEDGDKILKIAIIQPEQRLDLYGAPG